MKFEELTEGQRERIRKNYPAELSSMFDTLPRADQESLVAGMYGVISPEEAFRAAMEFIRSREMCLGFYDRKRQAKILTMVEAIDKIRQ